MPPLVSHRLANARGHVLAALGLERRELRLALRLRLLEGLPRPRGLRASCGRQRVVRAQQRAEAVARLGVELDVGRVDALQHAVQSVEHGLGVVAELGLRAEDHVHLLEGVLVGLELLRARLFGGALHRDQAESRALEPWVVERVDGVGVG